MGNALAKQKIREKQLGFQIQNSGSVVKRCNYQLDKPIPKSRFYSRIEGEIRANKRIWVGELSQLFT